MNGVWIALCILLVLFLIGQIRVGCKACYDADGPRVWIRLGLFYGKVFPLRPKADRDKKAKKEKTKGKKQKQPKQDIQTPAPMERVGGAIGYIQALLPVLLDALKYFKKKLQVDTLHLHLTAGSSDPADAAMLYGRASAALSALWTPLTCSLDVKDGYAKIDLDFEAGGIKLTAIAALSLKIWQVLWLAVYFGIRALLRFLGERKRQKQEKKLRKAV